jgi:mRNA turnover protein 4
MPKSKRSREVPLTVTKTKGKENKNELFDGIRNCIEEYERIFVFSVENMRNTYLKDVRNTFVDSRYAHPFFTETY